MYVATPVFGVAGYEVQGRTALIESQDIQEITVERFKKRRNLYRNQCARRRCQTNPLAGAKRKASMKKTVAVKTTAAPEATLT
jgi:hypothetical protein